MKLLAIDTSTNNAEVAVYDGENTYHACHSERASHAKVLLPMVDELLSLANLSKKELDGIVFGQGPGSFTGVRIAVSFAKGIASALDIPLIPVSSLAAMAHRAALEHQAERVLAIQDARMQEYYWGLYQVIEGQAVTLIEDSLSAAEQISVADDKPYLIAGNGLEELVLKGERVVAYPDARSLIAIALHSTHTVKADEAEPSYIRNKVTRG